jgi:hypothetical protein
MCHIYPVDAGGFRIASQPEVFAPISEATIELSANWQSPFEQSGPESKAPAFAALVQSGAAGPLLSALFNLGNDASKKADEANFIGRLAGELNDAATTMTGRSGMTKINAMQIFSGAPPMKINLTAHFKAFADGASEVQAPVDQLARWHLSQEMAINGTLVNAINAVKQGGSLMQAFFPSKSPTLVGFQFRGMYIAPMVIENMSYPLNPPCDAKGNPIEMSVQLTLATLTSLDAGDWQRMRSGRPIALFSNQNPPA